jgi:hypothetical protein
MNISRVNRQFPIAPALKSRKAALFSAAFQKSGSPGRIRTGDLSINSRMLYR